MISTTHRAQFHYNVLGRGNLILFYDAEELVSLPCRTGSISVNGVLKNALPIHPWYLCSGPEKPVDSEADLMFVGGMPGTPWKQCLWPIPEYSAHARTGNHYLIHPDGSREHSRDGNGTDGCIGILYGNGMAWVNYMQSHFDAPEILIIPVEVKLI